MTEILFVHGALVRDGAWWWRLVADLVEQRTGVTSAAVELPSCGEGGGAGGLTADATALHAALDATDSAIVVGHSYGGTVIAEGADHPAAAHLLYITSYLPDVGKAQADIMSGEPDPVRIAMRDDGTVALDGYDVDSFSERFLADVHDADIRAAAWARVHSQDVAAFGSPTTAAAWQARPSTYLVCTEDRSTSVALQRQHAARAMRSVDVPTGHHPFLSRPDLVADELERIIRAL